MEDLHNLNTEQINPDSIHIDEMDTGAILRLINSEDRKVADAVEAALPDIEKLIEAACPRLLSGGRVIYMGAGTSGRLGVLDASECPPTFGVEPELIQGIMAGGHAALLKAKEGAEDSFALGEADLKATGLTKKDTVIGLAASGRTPYVIGGLDYARAAGALTSSVSCVKNAFISAHADIPIEAVTGAEVITGSTRMKAGTAQKMILNMISTTLMIRYGKIYQNLMIDVQPTNLKLKERAKQIISLAGNCTLAEAADYLEQSGNHVKTAVCMAITGRKAAVCEELLKKNKGNVSKTIHSLKENA